MVDTSIRLESEQIICQDPLNLDPFFKFMPQLNRENDTLSLVYQAQISGENVLEEKGWQPEKAAAALRDLGMICASIRRGGMEPTVVAPSCNEALTKLAGVTGTVPRDTVFSYGPWNPKGERQRTFTDLAEEGIFINSFTKGM